MPRRAEFRGGVYVTGLQPNADGALVVEIFASRAVTRAELGERLTLTDSTGTRYEHVAEGPEVIDGRGRLVFTPALPAGARWLQLGEPGASHVWLEPWSA